MIVNGIDEGGENALGGTAAAYSKKTALTTGFTPHREHMISLHGKTDFTTLQNASSNNLTFI